MGLAVDSKTRRKGEREEKRDRKRKRERKKKEEGLTKTA